MDALFPTGGRSGFWIHYDEGQNGTAGCIGLHCSSAVLVSFWGTMKNYYNVNNHSAFLIVNFNSWNPNYKTPLKGSKGQLI